MRRKTRTIETPGFQPEARTTTGRYELRYILPREHGYIRFIEGLDRENAHRVAEHLSAVTEGKVVNIFDHDGKLVAAYDDGGLIGQDGARTYTARDAKGRDRKVTVPGK